MKAEEREILNELIKLLCEEIDEVDERIVELVRLRTELARKANQLQKKAALSTLESIQKFVGRALGRNRDAIDEANSREIM